METEHGFLSYPLFSNLGDSDAAHYEWEIVDFTSDGIDDLLISANYHSGTLFDEESAIFDLSSIPPKQIGYGPETTWSQHFSRGTDSQINENETPEVQIFSGDIVSCPPWATSSHRWNGQWFEQVDFEITDDETYFSLCASRINVSGWQILSEIEQLEFLLWFDAEFGDYQPTGSHILTGEKFSEDAQDEFRYIFAGSG